jgi:hypothetical protein
MTTNLGIGNVLDRDIDPVPLKKLFPLLGPASLFYRVILDEAQNIKNKTTKAALASGQLKSITRFCLTGTPMMNNVGMFPAPDYLYYLTLQSCLSFLNTVELTHRNR